jgi:hypothetical protein
MKKTKIIHAVLNGKYKEDFILEITKTKKGEKEGALTVPYVKWNDPETSYVAYRELPIKGRVLECIEKYYFDENVVTIPVEGHYDTVDMCDIYYEIMSPKIYEQMISGTFKISKNVKFPEDYANYIKREKENKAAIKKFINEQKKIGIEIKSGSILYARKIDASSSSDSQPTVVLVKKMSKNDKYKVQIHKMNPASGKNKVTVWQKEFDYIYDAKKMFDTTKTD